MVNRLLPASLLLICGCRESAPMPAEPAATSDPGNAAAAPEVVAQPRYALAGYEDLKLAAAEFAKTYDFLPPVSEMEGPRPETLDIFDCGEGYAVHEIGEIDGREERVEALARRVAVLEKTLAREGYQADVYRTPLYDYEQRTIAYLSAQPPPRFEDPSYSDWEIGLESLFQQLATDLERRRAELQPDQLPITAEGGCGASEAAFRITPSPDGGRVWMITQFAFDVCKVRRRDPWGLDSCRWSEVRPEQPAYLSGNYVYQAAWPGGARGRGKINLDGSFDEDEEPDVVTIRPD